MKKVFNFIKSYSTNPLEVDKLIVSAFLYLYKIRIINNKLLATYSISSNDKAYQILLEFVKIITSEKENFGVEDLIELFEFVISPEDKIVTGAVYTPVNIRKYIISQCLSKSEDINDVTICDPSCGCSGFLYTAAKFLKKRTNKTYTQIFKQNIFGLDIQEYSITRSKLLLTLFALSEGEVSENFEFNLFHGNALSFDWGAHINNYSGFQVIVGNPPYVCSRNMDDETLELLDKWSVTKSGHPDLYIPFFQIGYENLAEKGILGFITVNTFIKSINGRALRSYFAENKVALKIINFGGEQVFKDKNTYTCLCFLQKNEGKVLYKRTQSSLLQNLVQEDFFEYEYNNLSHHDGWNLVDTQNKNEFINKIESVGRPFKDLFETRNGIATLKNDVYKFKPFREDRKYYYMIKDEVEYPIEKAICRRIVNANKIKTVKDLIAKEEKIIFPYTHKGDEMVILPEEKFRKNYPKTFAYLQKLKKTLDKRDKGKVERYEAWYAYGRRQSMDVYAYKLFFPHICERPTFVICKDPELLFYNGIAVINDSLQKLIELKSLLESDIFFNYIKSTTKDYSSGYISLSRNYLKNFGILELTTEERKLLKAKHADHNQFWKDLYEKRTIKLSKRAPELA
ncbi:MAG: HsdM family class I SAM-dependent methyltransferase [Sediminibacterium sp.]